MRASSPITLALAIATLALSASRADLLVNGNFEAGNTGFTVSPNYTYQTSGATAPGIYGVVANPGTAYTSGYPSYGDHTTGSGLQLFVDGSTVAGSSFFTETVSVTANTNYTFAGFAAEASAGSPAVIQLFVNGLAVGTPLNLTGAPLGSFRPFTATLNSGLSTSLTLSLVDTNLSGGSNDFTVDDLSFNPSAAGVPEPSTLAMVSVGSAAVLAGRWRRKRTGGNR